MGLAAPWHAGSSQTRARTRVPCIGRQILNHCATREAPKALLTAPYRPLHSHPRRPPPSSDSIHYQSYLSEDPTCLKVICDSLNMPPSLFKNIFLPSLLSYGLPVLCFHWFDSLESSHLSFKSCPKFASPVKTFLSASPLQPSTPCSLILLDFYICISLQISHSH